MPLINISGGGAATVVVWQVGEACQLHTSSFTGRFASKLHQKETLLFCCCSTVVADGGGGGYFVEKLGEEYRHHGRVFGRYDLEMSGTQATSWLRGPDTAARPHGCMEQRRE